VRRPAVRFAALASLSTCDTLEFHISTDILAFYPLTLVPDGSDVVVGRRDIESYASFPADGAELLRRLRAGSSVVEAGRWYRERYGAAVDMADFVETLRDLKFVRSPGDPETAPVRRPRWQRLGRVVFSWPAWLLYLGVCGYALVLMVEFPYLRPSYESFFFTPSLLVMELGLLLGQLPGILLHEAMHALAARRRGVASQMRIANRFYVLVFETQLNGLWSLPRRHRYLPLLAGMLADLVWCASLVILARLTNPSGLSYAFPGAFFQALAASTLLRLCWQFYFYLRTDVYEVFVTALRCVDLHQTTKEYLTNRLHRLRRRPPPHDEDRWHPRDRQVARWYVYMFGLGYLLSLAMLAWFLIPAMARVLSGIATRLLTGAEFSARFVDGCLAFALNLVPLLIVAVLVLRRRRARRPG